MTVCFTYFFGISIKEDKKKENRLCSEEVVGEIGGWGQTLIQCNQCSQASYAIQCCPHLLA